MSLYYKFLVYIYTGLLGWIGFESKPNSLDGVGSVAHAILCSLKTSNPVPKTLKFPPNSKNPKFTNPLC